MNKNKNNRESREELLKRVTFKVYRELPEKLSAEKNHIDFLIVDSTNYSIDYKVINNTTDLGSRDILSIINDSEIESNGTINGNYIKIFS